MNRSPATPEPHSQTRQAAAICLGLVLAVAVVFGQTASFGFVNYDDDLYVYENPIVKQGLTLHGFLWAWSYGGIGHWHPLTWLSHMADCELYGAWVGGYHLTNVALHAAAAVFLFLALREMTGTLWRSACVAGLFAIHPLRAESVAWIAERKDVLSGMFCTLTLLLYARFVRRRSHGRYAAVVLACGLGLLCKNMLVTVPFVLLLLDWWPLQRMNVSFGELIREKIPMFIFGAGSCVATALVSEKVQESYRLPFMERLENAVVSCAIYLRQMIFPAALATPYPYPPHGYAWWEIAAALLLLATISAIVVICRKEHPYVLVGWLWYLGMLVPASGIIQISYYARADRYTYLPGIGLLLAGTWAVADWTVGWKSRRAFLGALVSVVMVAAMACAWKQTSYWRNSGSLWDHSLACTTNNFIAHYDMANYLRSEGKLDEAIVQYRQAVQARPAYAPARNNLGTLLRQEGRLDEAIAQFQLALQTDPDNESIHFNLARTLYQASHFADAVSQYESALRLDPSDVEAQNNLAWLLSTASEAKLRDGAQARQLARQANGQTGGKNPVILGTLAAALAEAGQFSEAAETAQRALALAVAQRNASLAAQLQAQMKLYEAGRPYHTQ